VRMDILHPYVHTSRNLDVFYQYTNEGVIERSQIIKLNSSSHTVRKFEVATVNRQL